ncbi:MAG: hypothetical protein EAZ88_04455 [Oscillatoriales cyanobacterium]|nr:MAG: hypothetical protein EAZ88_04455 [Oscillatoriales cyanobacterium]
MVLPSGFPEPANIGVIEVKQYPQYRAVTYTHAGDLRQATGIAFNPLFQHISNNQIAMTTPVEARYTATYDSCQYRRARRLHLGKLRK